VKRFALSGLVMTIDPLQGLALSPDGSRLVFRGRGDDGFDRLYVRELASFAVEPIPGTEQGFLPFFSADGAWVGFFTQGNLKKVALSGGSSLTLASVASATGGTWLPDGSILFASEVNGLERLPATAGTPEAVMVPGADTPLVISPWALPGGKGVLLGVRRGEFFDVAVLSLADRKLRVIAEDGFAPTYTPSGHVVFQQGQTSGTLLALPFDAERLVPTGAAFPVLSDIGTRISFQARLFSIAEDGTLAYIPNRAVLQRGALLWVDRTGASTPIVELDKPIDTPRLSPDGRLVAFRAPAPNCDVWVHDLKRGVTTRVTFEGDNHGVAWLPDARQVAFARQQQTEGFLLAGRADGSGAVERLSPRSVPRAWAASFSPDGRLLLVESRRAETGADVELLSIPDQTLKPLLHSRFDEKGASFSPDGRLIAYVSDESGRDEVYVQRFPGLDTRQQVSTDGGDEPVWSRSGTELFLRRGRKMLVADVKADPTLEISRPRLLFEADFATGAAGQRAYDISADDRRFVMTRPRSSSGGGEINVVLNWVDEMSRAEGTGRP